MKQEAVEFALQGGANRREIARRYGISAPSLYKWMERYRSQGIEGLQDNARRPLHSPKTYRHRAGELDLGTTR
jgi:transposase-like protein